MDRLRLAASAAVTLILLGLVTVLWGPAFALPASGRVSGIGPGALPQFSVLAIAGLAVVIFVRDLIHMRKTGGISGASSFGDGAEPLRVVFMSVATMLALGAYVTLWSFIGFPAASVIFLTFLSALLLPREQWSVRSLATLCAVSVGFGIGVWALFVYVLQVPLR
jgi:hypothetical protein